MSAVTILETPRLRLRTWAEGDAEQLDRACNTLAVMRWLGGVQSHDQLIEDVEYFQESQEEDGHTFWVMESKEAARFLGFCGFVLVPDEDSTVEGELEIGWRLRADEWRKGYAEEAARASLAYAFEKLEAKRVVSRTAAGNQASQGLMKKLGMRRCPELDYDPEDGSDRLLVYVIGQSARKSAARAKRR